MKKVLTVLFVVVLLLIAGIYLFIPGKIQISKTVLLRSAPSGTFSYLSEKENWNNWWPGEKNTLTTSSIKGSLFYNGYNYQVTNKIFNSIGVFIRDKNNFKITSTINILPKAEDSVAIEWRGILRTSRNPIKRVQQLHEAQEIKNNMSIILKHLQLYLLKKEISVN